MASGLTDWRTYTSARGTLLELIRGDAQIPPGTILFEDPPLHDAYRALLARLFIPRRIAEIEPQLRAYCARSLNPLVGGGRIDFIADLAQLPQFEDSDLGISRTWSKKLALHFVSQSGREPQALGESQAESFSSRIACTGSGRTMQRTVTSSFAPRQRAHSTARTVAR